MAITPTQVSVESYTYSSSDVPLSFDLLATTFTTDVGTTIETVDD